MDIGLMLRSTRRKKVSQAKVYDKEGVRTLQVEGSQRGAKTSKQRYLEEESRPPGQVYLEKGARTSNTKVSRGGSQDLEERSRDPPGGGS